MRISSLYMFQRQISNLANSNANFNDIAARLAQGQSLLKPSDDPAGASQAVIYQNSLAKLEQYETARQYAQDTLGQQDNVLNSISSLLSKNLSEKIVAGGNGTYSDEDRMALATELEGIRDNLMNLANSRNSNGRYIFAGYNTGSEPFAKDGTYLGGKTPIVQLVADSTAMQVSHTGDDVFMSGTPDDLFAALDSAIEALKVPVTEDADREALQLTLDRANVSIKKNIDNLGKVQARVGTNLQQLDMLGSSADKHKIDVESSLQETLGADLDTFTTLSIQSKMVEFALNSSYMVFQSMQQMSIFNMLR
ncbi:flagellar hook-associated protein 3 [Mixta theicola]|uniref:Flagellar hook-associated protein 3 n=1 Tax=Mixta theicola TaxID=1458355 RepID=A0A2K1Q851_9GAMM|nr:flagellar hook-associated protein FlgL [Mixta theicola]PNS11206.1 flagellar hook-associated protein 3 [Mixta theicola]GLR07528.1 flagellar hook-associated protein 3 [Mixta theicola]